ncbi:transcription termination/antitermination protein NusA [Candidatus Woesebacteria bacterium]|nr:transcription termination/antitermination protein NusA [Candidatus Woesebacteria bacterium]
MQSSNSTVIRTEFAAAISQIAKERKIDVESIYEAIRQALVSAFRKQYGLDEEFYYYATLNPENGESQLFRAPVTARDEETLEPTAWDEKKSEDVTPAGFGRIAAQTAKQVILQKIRESEKEHIIAEYQEKVGEILSAQILRMDGRKVVLDLGRGYGIMPPEEQMRGEFYRVNSRITVYIKEIRESFKGKVIIVSRADAQLVSQLFAREVPEVGTGAVEVALIAREAGVRTKLAVRSTQEGVDPVGACVGQRGVRVQEVIRELNNEKLDIIPFTEDPKLLLQAALAPAENLKIELDEATKMATVTAPDDQLSLAIGRGGQNVRLAAKLTGYRITIKSASGQVESEVTGDEEYEIDTFEGLAPETREMLIEHKLTTLTDLSRFKDKWMAFELPEDQATMLSERVTVFDQEQAERGESLAEKARMSARNNGDDRQD